MTNSRRNELIKQCSTDLQIAYRQNHAGWIQTLTVRLAALKKIRPYEFSLSDKPLIVRER